MAKMAIDTRGTFYNVDGKWYLRGSKKEEGLRLIKKNIGHMSCACHPEGFSRPFWEWSDGVIIVGFHDCAWKAAGNPPRRVFA